MACNETLDAPLEVVKTCVQISTSIPPSIPPSFLQPNCVMTGETPQGVISGDRYEDDGQEVHLAPAPCNITPTIVWRGWAAIH